MTPAPDPPEQDPAVDGAPVYLSGLRLRGRRVLLAGGGRVAVRRLRRLLEAGADVEVIAPHALPEVRELAEQGRIRLELRAVRPDDVDRAWYVMAATDDPEANRTLGERCEALHIFCVRSDDAYAGTAWTPAVGHVDGFSVGVVGNRDPRGSVRLLRRLLGRGDGQPVRDTMESGRGRDKDRPGRGLA